MNIGHRPALERQIDWIAKNRPAPPAPRGPSPLYTTRVIDRRALDRFDALWPEVFALFTHGAPAFALKGEGGDTIAELIPTDAGQRTDGDLNVHGYELLVAQHGHEDTGEASDEWLEEGRAAMFDAMPDDAMKASPMRMQYRLEADVRLRQAEAIGRGHHMPPEQIASVTGRPYVARRSLIPTGAFVPRLAEAKAAREAAEARAAEQVQAARVEAARPKSLRELGLVGVEVRVDNPLMVAPKLLDTVGVSWWAADRKSYFAVWPAIVGLEVPVLELDAFRVLRDDMLAPTHAFNPGTVTSDVYAFIRQLLELEGRSDTGPVETFDGELADARELLDGWARFVYGCAYPDLWRRVHQVELLVRGHRIRPDVVAVELQRRSEAIHLGQFQPYQVPSLPGKPGTTERRGADGKAFERQPFVQTFEPPVRPMPGDAWPQVAIETACIAAAKRGLVVPGCLLSKEAVAPSPIRAQKKQKTSPRSSH